jgi:hypothetical protein
MPSWIKDTLDYIAAEGRVLRGAPVAFSVFVLLAGLALWGALSWKFDAQVSSRDAIIGASPDNSPGSKVKAAGAI